MNWTSSNKNFCASQDTIRKIKIQATDWENIFASTTPALKECIFFRGYRGNTINELTRKISNSD